MIHGYDYEFMIKVFVSFFNRYSNLCRGGCVRGIGGWEMWVGLGRFRRELGVGFVRG
jgi:hypothetical protein